ncbi:MULTISPECIES: MarR family transcriptional regulator [Priestia]|uniref:MarR family transcriptional regulator n=1 Tax=Priestia TaxID=2800373 RepID=UPI0012B842E4|nr:MULTISPECIES: MarR family transcriptional regulator [Priestia]MBY0213789.1 MarR family transcriptional regulator [Priestia aryabhattai]MCM2978733.1 MarR family transcriptional regulator [Priestia aryabhattai]MCQ9285251.1 MarR family transcriptional regulator [Priestia aryabhattai]MEB4861250.1 MarR family transcriptional regulator [Priestia megaterium]MED3922713.1 MarR family transcriptional regulator [Priestia aryabhattai]
MSLLSKQLIYENYLQLLHLNEQKADSVSQTFFDYLDEKELNEIGTLPSNMSSIHVIECIGNNGPINNIGIATRMNLSKANITKITRTLTKDELIKRFQLADNKKEVYFKLTAKGKQVFELHEKLHSKRKRQFYDLIDDFSDDKQKIILEFLETMINKLRQE